ncbi:hypothetical protein H6771_01720 [Candidatus Peribacteria bacterium]|nr:hypothetical protein [Candidatus Peribacteria bacterium]
MLRKLLITVLILGAAWWLWQLLEGESWRPVGQDEDRKAPVVFQLDNGESTLTDVQMEATVVSAEGEACGGTTGMDCHPALYCDYDPTTEDLRGVCVNTVVDSERVCEKENDPVCGLLLGQKMGFGSHCEAERHGAEILYSGFCKADSAVAGSCTAPLRGIDRCEKQFTGVFFNPDTGACERGAVLGCTAELPFTTTQACEAACL